MVRRVGFLFLVVLLGFGSVGCQDEPKPKFDPDATLSGVPSSSATATAEPDRLNPVETVRAWVAARNLTMRTGDSTDVYALSTSDCPSCKDLIEPVVEVHENGGRFATKGWRVVRAKRDPGWARNHLVVAGIESAAGRTWPSKGADPVKYEVDRHIIEFTLVMERGRWLIDQVVRIP